MGSAVFTLSLDCEGLWGMADRPETIASGAINATSLDHAYARLLGSLGKNGVRATAAFVAAFAAPRTALLECAPLLNELAAREPGWFRSIQAMLRGDGDSGGWEGATLWQRTRAEGHEMGWHGATHLSLDDSTPPEVIDLELETASRLFEALGHRPTSLVFPRNLMGHFDQLRRFGFDTYRPARSAPRLADAVREWNVLDGGDRDQPRLSNGWGVTTAGYFLNWPSGPRRLVPPAATVARWRSMLRSAVRHGRHVHMWFHPHNLITAPEMFGVFDTLMSDVGQLLRSGDLLNQTMGESVRHIDKTEALHADQRGADRGLPGGIPGAAHHALQDVPSA